MDTEEEHIEHIDEAGARRRIISITRTSVWILSWILAIGSFLAFCAFVVVSDRWDWDHFYAMHAVELSGWLTEGWPPLWSYQLCGGMSRIADPQSFGFSPLFIFMFLFGPIWGTKVSLFILYPISMYFFMQIAYLLLPSETKEERWSATLSGLMFGTSFTASGYFLWQIVSGHYTQMMMYLVMALFYFNLKAIKGPLSKRDWFLIIFVGWTYFSGGVYHSLVFLWIPFSLALFFAGIGLGIYRLIRRRDIYRYWLLFLRVFFLNTLSILPGLYKMLPVFLYQLDNARGGGDDWDTDPKLLSLLLFQFFPTIGPNLGFFKELVTDEGGNYKVIIWELGAFSPISWLLVLALIAACLRFLWKGPFRGVREALCAIDFYAWFVFVFGLVSFFLALGNFSPWAPYTLFNKYIMANSVHITDRFAIAITLSWGLCALWLIGKSKVLSAWFPTMLAIPTLAVALANFWTFFETYGAPFGDYGPGQYRDQVAEEDAFWALPDFSVEVTRRMDTAVVYNGISWPPMLTVLREGKAFLNCYNPLIRRETLKWFWEPEARRQHQEGGDGYRYNEFPFVIPPEDASDSVKARCLDRSYFTQSQIYLDAACPKGTCLNLNDINPRDQVRKYLEEQNGRYCITKDRGSWGYR